MHSNSSHIALEQELDSFFGNKEKKKAKADLLRAKGEAKVLNAQASLELAKQGVVNKNFGNLASVSVGSQASREASPDEDPAKKKDTTTYVVIAVVLVIVVAAVFFLKKKK